MTEAIEALPPNRREVTRLRDEVMACQELVELVTEYFEGALPEGERVRFDRHLGECEGCTNYLEQMRTTIRLAGTLSEESIPPEGKEELLRVLRSWKGG